MHKFCVIHTIALDGDLIACIGCSEDHVDRYTVVQKASSEILRDIGVWHEGKQKLMIALKVQEVCVCA